MGPGKKIIWLLAGGVIIFFSGFFLGRFSLSLADGEKIREATLNELREKLALKTKDDLISGRFWGEPRESLLDSLEGEIVSIDRGRSIVKIKVANPYRGGDFFDYLNEPNYYLKEVKIEETTEILERKRKDREVYRQEREKAEREGKEPPSRYIETPLIFKDLKEGEEVEVETGLTFQLREDKVIPAKRIVIER